jgi:hypothetical protein
VIETWLDNHYDNLAFGHAFGYNAEEPKRVDKSEAGEPRTQYSVRLQCRRAGRMEKAKQYDRAQRHAFYPLVEWGWTRQDCLD